MPKLNQDRFRKQCRTVSQSEIAAALGKSQQVVSKRLQNLSKLTVDEFLAICEVIEEPYENFIEGRCIATAKGD